MADINQECEACAEGLPMDECPTSERPCGHHCNHSWTHDECCWCGAKFEEEAPPAGLASGTQKDDENGFSHRTLFLLPGAALATTGLFTSGDQPMDLGHFAGWNWRDVFETGLTLSLAGAMRHIVLLHRMINRLRRQVRETARFTDLLTRANREMEEAQRKEPWVGR